MGGEGEKACLRELGVVSVIKFKTRVCLNKFSPRLYLLFLKYVQIHKRRCMITLILLRQL